MSTLLEIETAADSLTSEEKERWLRFLAMSLRKERALPKPRIYSADELASMIAEDEADGKRFRQGRRIFPTLVTKLLLGHALALEALLPRIGI